MFDWEISQYDRHGIGQKVHDAIHTRHLETIAPIFRATHQQHNYNYKKFTCLIQNFLSARCRATELTSVDRTMVSKGVEKSFNSKLNLFSH